ncbi:adenylyl-sulfate kinase [Emticicia sp. TH156]|uniref:adenylyl-sulfate kinase n=1 Tax=Emticicia sp. TH156 TaxID=2067454 RepID=UPI000C781C2D|nr:adenylyl-sulfate kinase [Emticicia sp. TH156]PLK43287.1 adenylyl-sulfate kinase [Emticicia sp. TH156]
MVSEKAAVIWLTGLSGAGKTTIARELIEIFHRNNLNPVLLDGDEIRSAIEQTGFDEASRKVHNLRIGRLAALFEQQGHPVIVSMISPYDDIRQSVRALCQRFVEVFVNTPLETCIERDPKGLYKKAISKQIDNFTGISAPYDIPQKPEIELDTTQSSVTACALAIWQLYKS